MSRQPAEYGSSPQAAALRRQLAKLAALEQTPVYREMCAAATSSKADGTYETRKWGAYNSATGRKGSG